MDLFKYISNLEVINKDLNLNLFIEFYFVIKISPNIFEEINNIRSLKVLSLSNFKFKQKFILNVNNLEELSLSDCKNITFKENSTQNLKKLKLDKSTNIHVEKDNFLKLKRLELSGNITEKSKLKFPELEEYYCSHYSKINLEEEITQPIVDYKSLNKLKSFDGPLETFLLLENTLLEKVIIFLGNFYGFIKEKEMIEKLTTIKTLKIIDLELTKTNYPELRKIKRKNFSVEEMHINLKGSPDIYILTDLINIFPNLSFVQIIYYSSNYFDEDEINIKINENKNSIIKKKIIKCKVTKIGILIQRGKIELCCQSFETLEKIILRLNALESNEDKPTKLFLKFPIFEENNQRVFKSLKYFLFYYNKELYFSFFNNMFNNIDNMPNLVYFIFKCNSIKNIKKDIFLKFIEKILSLKYIKYIDINIGLNDDKYDNKGKEDKYYSIKELKIMFPKINHKKFDNFNTIEIKKLINKIV